MMRAVGYQHSLEIEHHDALVDIELPRPTAKGCDVLVEVKAISVNPIDTKVRMRAQPPEGEWKVLGWDAAGVVVEVGDDVTDFKVGDEVFYAGSLSRDGTNAQFHLVDSRIIALKPRSLSWVEAAALPLTSITAYEVLFDRLRVAECQVPGAASAIVIIGGAGGVGSMAVQLARQLTDLTVLSTASRDATKAWVEQMGAHMVLDHSQPLSPQVEAVGIGAPGFAFSITHTDQHQADIAHFLSPQGHMALIDDPAQFQLGLFKGKSIAIHWESMFTRSLFGTPDMARQGEILAHVAKLVDEGKIKTTLAQNFGPINAVNLKRAHALLESHGSHGKIVLEGF